MRTVKVLIGNIGSGKTTYVNSINVNKVVLSKDDIRKFISNGIGTGYIYDDRVECYIDGVVINTYEACLITGVGVIIIDETNMKVSDREPFIALAKKYDYKVDAVVFNDYGEDEHVRRRLSNNHGDTSEETWRRVYRDNLSVFNYPSYDEGFDLIIDL